MSLHSSLTQGLSKDENFPQVWPMPYCAFQKRELWSLKAVLTIAFFAAVNHIYFYDSKQQTFKYRNT